MADESRDVSRLFEFHALARPVGAQSVSACLPLQRQAGQGVVQRTKEEVARLLKAGQSLLGAGRGGFAPFLDQDLMSNLYFCAGLIGKAGFDFRSLYRPLLNIHSHLDADAPLRQDVTHHLEVGLKMKMDYEAALRERNTFRAGRIGEFIGMRGEIQVAEKLINSGEIPVSLGREYRLSRGGVQEVDLTLKRGGVTYFVEIAASPAMLTSKLNHGADPDDRQQGGYRALQGDTPDSQFVYSCPTLKLSTVSDELVGKLADANALYLLGTEILSPDELMLKVEQARAQSERVGKRGVGKKAVARSGRPDGGTRRNPRNDAPARLRDRGGPSKARRGGKSSALASGQEAYRDMLDGYADADDALYEDAYESDNSDYDYDYEDEY